MSGKGRIVEHIENEVENVGVTNDNGDIYEHATADCRFPADSKAYSNGIIYCCRIPGMFNEKNCTKLIGQTPPPKFSYFASCVRQGGNRYLDCKCDPAAKGYKLDYNICKADSTVKACPIVNKKQLILGSYKEPAVYRRGMCL